MDWIIHTISIIGVFAVVFYLLSKYERVKDEMVANNILGQIRNEYFFLQEFKNWEFYKSPNETNEQFFKRLPQSKYVDYLKDEYMTAREALINKLDIKPSEAESILDSLYGFELKKSKKKDEPNRDKQQISK